jgi:hypothetical protein
VKLAFVLAALLCAFALPADARRRARRGERVRYAFLICEGACHRPARFDQVEGVTDAERDRAWKRILTAAKRHG